MDTQPDKPPTKAPFECRTVVELRRICAKKRIKNYGQMRKEQIIAKLVELEQATASLERQLQKPIDFLRNLYASKIQNWYRHWKTIHTRTKFVNSTCAFTLEKHTRWLNRFVHVLCENQVFQFDPHLLVQYILTSGKFANPFTRTDFNAIELSRLSKMTNQKQNLVSIKNIVQQERRQAQQQQETRTFLTNECLQAYECLVTLAQQNSHVALSFLWSMCSDVLVVFFESMNNLATFDFGFAEQMMGMYMERTNQLGVAIPRLREFCRAVHTFFMTYVVGRFQLNRPIV
jgi:hypothetical protein